MPDGGLETNVPSKGDVRSAPRFEGRLRGRPCTPVQSSRVPVILLRVQLDRQGSARSGALPDIRGETTGPGRALRTPRPRAPPANRGLPRALEPPPPSVPWGRP